MYKPGSGRSSVTRIHILGPAGSGKTTLGERLAGNLLIPFYELDNIAWEKGFPGTDRPLESRLHDIQRIASQPAWITEGIFLVWTEELLRLADFIVWLDMPWHLTLRRTIARRFQWTVTEANPPPSGIGRQWGFLKYMIIYYFGKNKIDTRVFTAEHVQKYHDRLVHCRRPSEVEAFFQYILLQRSASNQQCPAEVCGKEVRPC
jgi:adenylate kinase family enzyme